MPLVTMPDGAVVDMPDNPTAEQLAGLRQLQSNTPGTAESVLRKLTSGAVRAGGANAAGLTELLSLNPIVAAARLRSALGGSGAISAVPKVIDATAQSLVRNAGQSADQISANVKMNPYAGSFLEGVSGAAMNPTTAAAPVTGLVAGGFGGAGSELSAHLLGEGPVQRLLGGLVGGVLGGAGVTKLSSLAPNVQTLAKEGLEGITPEQLQSAKSFMEKSAAQGVNVDITQALEAIGVPSGNLTTIRNVLANNKSGNAVQSLLRHQPQQLDILAAKTVGGLPGSVRSTDVAANNLQEAATDVISSAKAGRGEAWKNTVAQETQKLQQAADAAKASAATATQSAELGQVGAQKTAEQALADMLAGKGSPEAFLETVRPLAEASAATRAAKAATLAAEKQGNAAAAVPADSVLRAAARLGKLAAERPNTGEAAKLTSLQQALFREDGMPITDPEQLNRILVSESNKLKAPDLSTSGVSAGQAKWLASQIQAVRASFGDTFTPIKKANEGFARTTAETIDPLRQGLVGQFATPRGYKPDVAAAQTKFVNLMQKGEDPQAAVSNIRTFGRQLATQNPEALPDAVKTYVSGEIGKAFPPDVAGSNMTAPEAAGKLWGTLFADRNRYNGLKQAVAASAESLGQKPEDVVRGLDNFAQITAALKARPQSVGGLQRQEVFQIGGKSYGADAMRIFGFLPFEKAARGVEDRVMAHTFRQFDQLLTTPEGAAKLAELGKVPAISQKAVTIFNSIGAGLAGASEGSKALSGQQ